MVDYWVCAKGCDYSSLSTWLQVFTIVLASALILGLMLNIFTGDQGDKA